MNATDRIVEKNEKFWKLLTDPTLTDVEKLKLINEIFSSGAILTSPRKS